MKLKIYQVDAFTDKLFSGNSAAICPLDKWLPVPTMMGIASETNQSATAFFVQEGKGFYIRWFSPAAELHLCGQATLAAAHILYTEEGYKGKEIHFNSQSGDLIVKKDGDYITLNFPIDTIERVKTPAELSIALNIKPQECFKGQMDFMLVYKSEKEILNLKPNFYAMKRIRARGFACTAKGTKSDFVSRFFAPSHGIDEDSVTGSAHATLIPYWSKILGKKQMSAMQLSTRGGHLNCLDLGDRVEISGQARTFMRGEIEIN
ncbi:MAG TPA: PhzF family phenazine biosynthesis protein [Bacteroidia bacterium]|jgi:PhzF family phenazine biosynthesis protein|nr:PhzF family phenazine biosynthesis protein [Bacteroidia bacterium]